MRKNNLNIIYEDKDILAINKPAGLLTHPAGKSKVHKLTLVDYLLKHCPLIKKVGDEPENRPGLVHRLDKDTSGVLLVAKNQEAYEYLKNEFKNRKVKKTYLALVEGIIKEKEGEINLPFGRSKKDFRKWAAVGKKRGKLREALTLYKVKKRFDDYTLVEVYPQTGRTHQIRSHFKAIGHPIVCDSLYGSRRSVKKGCPFGLTRQFLHALSLEFSLPDGSRLKLEADLPEELETALKKLENQR
ncbi:MAG: RluA family pseudouridine synthase [Patescibacteria group bacterium]